MKSFLKVIIFFAIIAAGVGVFVFFSSSRTEAERKPLPPKVTVVEVTEALATDERAIVAAMGTVVPAKSVTLSPEVGGRVVAQSDKLVPGGRFRKGQIVVRVDPRDYNLALEQQRARITTAKMNLATERGRAAVAKKEWNLIGDEVRPSDEGKKLALREVQVENAEASVAAAESAMAQAKLARTRTVISAPFDALVTEEFVDVGQVVGPGTRIATLVASDAFWVRVSVPMDRLSWIRIPGVNGKDGSPARVMQQVGSAEAVVRSGRVIRLLGDLDPLGKMARLLVEVDNPLGSGDEDSGGLPLLLGAYVSVEIEGPELDDMVALPRLAVREGGKVWVKSDDKLSIRKVDVTWTREDTVFVRGEIQPGESVITSRVAAPVEGMKIALEDEIQRPGDDDNRTRDAGAPPADSKAQEKK
ncbi:MAG: efflux RND transporter periplasmic adaptor subunit [Deltaproteobacteria bacterium]|nr:efflux RND transporter periplasmic adaptor subunit [Deltaproteobacteria bacterium]